MNHLRSNINRNGLILLTCFLFLTIPGCKNEFQTYLNQFPVIKNDTTIAVPSLFDCAEQKEKYPAFFKNNKKWLYHLSLVTDTNNVVWPVAAIQLKKNHWAIVTGSCHTMDDDYSPQFRLCIFDDKHDSLQYFILNPYLFEEANGLAILYQKEKFIMLYQHLTAGYFFRISWELPEGQFTYKPRRDTLTTEQFKQLYPDIKYREFVLEEEISRSIPNDTIYTAKCDLDRDGEPEKILLIKTTPENEVCSVEHFLSLKVERYSKAQSRWNTWIETNKLLPVTDGRFISSEITKCGNGSIELVFFQNQDSYKMNFQYSANNDQLMLMQLFLNDRLALNLEYTGMPITEFDFIKYYFGSK